MRILVTGSSGHLGEALVRELRAAGDEVLGLDRLPSPHTGVVASITDRAAVREAVDLADVVTAHLAALGRAPETGFGRYVVSATTPFRPADLAELRRDAPAVVERLFPGYREVYAALGWRMFPAIDRVYVNDRARAELGWEPRYDFRRALDLLREGRPPRSELAVTVGAKGYHPVPR